MNPNIQTVATIPKETYFVAYPGTIGASQVVTIPNKHRREGDVADNPQVRVIIQNIVLDYSNPNWQWEGNIISVLDVTNTNCAKIIPGQAWQLETDATLKLFGLSPFSFQATQEYCVIVFYQKP